MSTILKHMKTRKRRPQTSLKITRNKRTRAAKENDNTWIQESPGGVFQLLPMEVCNFIFTRMTLQALGNLSLTSSCLRNMVVTFVFSSQAADSIIPNINAAVYENKCFSIPAKYHHHYKSLGFFVKRSSCLFSTKERLKKVGQVLDKLRESHITICNEHGSDLAYSCYGEFLHAFVAGWEFEEKVKAFNAIKGASLLEERVAQVLKSEPGTHPGYERYIRIFCREIFLDKSDDIDLPFWLAQILKPWPMCLQAKILYVLYGPLDEENDELQWDTTVVLGGDLPTHDGFAELGKAFRIILNDTSGHWNADDAVSLFEELTGVPVDWEIECIASVLAQSGEVFCCEVLGNKAINGRTRELSYLLYHIWQILRMARKIGSMTKHDNCYLKKGFTASRRLVNVTNESFVILVKHLSKLIKNQRKFQEMLNHMFKYWEESVMEDFEEYQYASDSQREEGNEPIRNHLQTLISLTATLLAKDARSSS